ncbi:rod-binding protein, partial [Klebsiella pneumoniae]|uniref:rod-binding protein n=1 Tax=Klebsiella pneumoniae TaxID=573 RepID=UPI002731B00B
SEMLKSMRSATEALGKDNPLNTPAAKQYQEMYDQQLAVSMSREGGGIGLADVIVVSLGVDTFKDDPISQFKLDSPDY